METGTHIRKATSMASIIDFAYEFCAPRFFDFCVGETEEEAAAAERWFIGAVSYHPSPLVGKVKSVQELSTGCSLEEYIGVQKLVARVTPELSKAMDADGYNAVDAATKSVEAMQNQALAMSLTEAGSAFGDPSTGEPCTPKEQFPERFVELQTVKAPLNSGRIIPSKYNCSDLHKQALMKSVKTLAPSKSLVAKRCLTGPQKPHAAKKQKLEGGHSSQVLSTQRPQAKPTLTISQQFRLNAEKHGHKRQKLEGGQVGQVMHAKIPRAGSSLTIPHEFHFHTDKRAQIHKGTGQCSLETQAASSNLAYIPIAEMVQRFQKNLLGEFKSQVKTTLSQKACLRLTHPKEPMLGTSMRARPPSVKSFFEQEEEMLAKIPKFKARPLNKKILKGPTLLPPSRSTPHLPEFQEFNLKTMERALMYKHASRSMHAISGLESRDQTCMARGNLDIESRMKIAHELEPELAALQKFRARPLDKRIFSSRGDVGVYTVLKRQATIPKEFHFATNLRAQQQSTMTCGQQNQEQRVLQPFKFERTIYAKGLHAESAHTPIPATSSILAVKHYDENQNMHHHRAVNGKACEFSLQKMAGEANIGVLSNDRIRKPLVEIQQQLVVAQSVYHVQRPKMETNDYLNTSLARQEEGSWSRKEFTPHLTGGRALERQVQNAAFPMCLMR